MFEDPGPDLEFEQLVGTKKIVEKYQKLLYKEKPIHSDSSDEPFQFNLPPTKEERIRQRQEEDKRLIAARKKLTSREVISTYRKRYKGAGSVFQTTNKQSKVFNRMDTHSSVESQEDRTAKIDSSSTKKSAKRVVQPDSQPESFRNSDIELT